VAALAGAAETTDFNPVIGAFIKPMTQEFGWSRSAFVGAQSLGTMLGGIVAIGIGPLLDRFGARWIMFTGFLLLGGALISLSAVGTLWQFYILTAVARIAVGAMIGLSIGVLVPQWFVRKRGRAVAMSNLGVRFGVAFNPVFAQSIISGFGWRAAIISLGLYTWALTLLPTSLLIRRRPEDLGLLPDGDPPEAIAKNGQKDNAANSKRKPVNERSWTVKDALRSRTFYLLMASFSLVFFVSTGINLHLLAFMNDRGISPGMAVIVLTTWSSIGVIGTLFSGFMAERISIRNMAIFVYGFLALGVFVLSQVHSLPMAFAFAVVHGVVWGANNNLQVLLFSDYFGRHSLGAIRGITSPVQTGASALGPLASAAAFDSTGSYTLIFIVFAGLLLMSAALMFLAQPPQRAAANQAARA
jgi:MFS family permease